MSQPAEFTDANFQQEVVESDKPVLVDFWAEWCGPCKMIGPTIAELAEEYDGKVKIGKVNIDENTESPGKHNIRSIPSLLIFKGGAVVDSIIGVVPKTEIKRRLDAHLA